MAGVVVVAVVVAVVVTMTRRTKEEAEGTMMMAIRAVGAPQGGATQEAGDTRMMDSKDHPEVRACAARAAGCLLLVCMVKRDCTCGLVSSSALCLESCSVANEPSSEHACK